MLIHLPPRYLVSQFSQEPQWLVTYQVFQDQCLPHLGHSIIKLHTFPTKVPYTANLPTTFLRTPHFVNIVQPTPQPIDPNTDQSQDSIAIGESEPQSSYGSTRAKTWIESDGNG